MGKLRANSEIISDKSKNPVTTSTYIKHGNQWLDDAVNNAIGAAASKADKTYVDSELTKKANKSDTDAALSSKADKSALEATNASVSANTSNIQGLSTESTILSARMDEFTKLEEGSTTGDAELIDGRIGSDGKTYDNIGGAIRGQVTDLKSDLVQLYPIEHNDRLYVSKWEQGRYTANVGSKAEKNETDSDSVKAIRIRTDLFDINENIKIRISDGYSAQIIRTDKNGIVTKEESWKNLIVIDVSTASKCAIVVKNNSGANISKDIGWDIVEITKTSISDEKKGMSNALDSYSNSYEKSFIGIKYSYGGISTTNYDAVIKLNDISGADKRIRTEKPININGYFRIESDDGYIAEACLVDNAGKWKGTITEGATKYRFYIVVRKSDNTNISISEAYEHVRLYVSNHKTFTFESGSSGTSNTGYYVQNNDPAALPIRLRTNPTLIDTPVRIKAKDGYTFGLNTYIKDSTGYLRQVEFIEYTPTGQTTWLTDFVIPASDTVYYCIVIKPTSGNVYPFRVNQYLDIDYNYAEKSVGGTADRYNGMKCLFIGDSITEVNFTASANWTRLITSWFGFDATNIATGGSGIVRGGNNAWNTKIDSITGDYDLILIMGNMNDYSGNVFNESKLGQFGDKGLNTQYGAVNTFLKKVLDKWPLAKVGWITSTPRQYLSGDPDNPDPVVSDGYLWSKTGVFENADKAIMEVCHNYSVPVLDMFHESSLQAWNTAQRTEFFYNDGNSVHPNNKGHMIMAMKIADFIKRNF